MLRALNDSHQDVHDLIQEFNSCILANGLENSKKEKKKKPQFIGGMAGFARRLPWQDGRDSRCSGGAGDRNAPGYVLFWCLAAVPLRHAPRMQRDQACSAPRTTSCSRWLWCCFFSKFSLPCPSRTWLPSRSSTGVADLWKHNLQVSRWARCALNRDQIRVAHVVALRDLHVALALHGAIPPPGAWACRSLASPHVPLAWPPLPVRGAADAPPSGASIETLPAGARIFYTPQTPVRVGLTPLILHIWRIMDEGDRDCCYEIDKLDDLPRRGDLDEVNLNFCQMQASGVFATIVESSLAGPATWHGMVATRPPIQAPKV